MLSGVNRGQNLADDVTYSGTVAGAIEGTAARRPSIAMSLALEPRERRDGRAQLGDADAPRRRLVASCSMPGWPEGVVLNVNFPDCAPDEVEAWSRPAGPAQSGLPAIEDRLDTRGKPYYWVGFERRSAKPPKGTDLWAVQSSPDLGHAAPPRLSPTWRRG